MGISRIFATRASSSPSVPLAANKPPPNFRATIAVATDMARLPGHACASSAVSFGCGKCQQILAHWRIGGRQHNQVYLVTDGAPWVFCRHHAAWRPDTVGDRPAANAGAFVEIGVGPNVNEFVHSAELAIEESRAS